MSLFAEPARTLIHYDGSSATYFQIDGTWEPREAPVYFEYRSLEYNKEDRAVEYVQMPKQEKLKYLLKYIRPHGMIPTERVVVRMRNLGDASLRIGLQWATSRETAEGTTAWYGWLFQDSHELPADGEWHELVFRTSPKYASYNGAATSNEIMYGPDGRLDICVPALPAGVETHYQVAEIRGEDDVTPQGTLQWQGDFPTEMTAGETIAIPGFTADFQGRAPFDQEVALVFKPCFKDELYPTLTIPLKDTQKNGMTWTTPAQEIELTQFLLDGDYQVTVKCGEGIFEDAVFPVKVNGRQKVDFPAMSMREFGGRPTMFRGEEPLPGVMRATYIKEGPRNIRTFTDCGINLFGFCANTSEGSFNLSYTVEFAPGKYDFQQLDRRIRTTLDANPNAFFNIRVAFNAPRWWSQDHLDDVVWDSDPKDPEGGYKPLIWHLGMRCPSWASRTWREYSKEGIRHMMAFLEESPYADRITGFVLASGTTEEWMEWASLRGAHPDYSPVARQAFRQWLSAKYGSDQALQEAWNDSAVTLATAELPNAYQRVTMLNYPGFMDPANPMARPIADYNRYHSETVADCVAELCKEVKDASHGKLLCGAFYGYEVELAGTYRELLTGHIGVGALLNCPYLDYLCSPSGYEFRQMGGDGMSYAMGAADSLQLHNKFWFIENDIRTSATGDNNHGGTADVQGDILQQTKESMHNLLSGMAQWWFDVGYIKFVDQELLDCIAKCVQVMEDTTLKYTRKPVAQVAMVIDEESIDWTTTPTEQVGNALRGFQRTQLAPMGTPYEVYLSNDLPNLPERIRILFLPMSLAWKPEHKAALEKFLTDGRVVCFIGTPGVIPPAGMSAQESAQAFTGLPLSFLTAPAKHVCLVDSPDGNWLSQSAVGQSYQSGPWMNAPGSHLLAVLNPAKDVVILGHYAEQQSGKNSKAGALGVKELPEATILFSGVSNLPREFMEKAYEKAGVHRYVTTADQVWATENVFAVCVKDGGEKQIRLPKDCTQLKDLFSEEIFPVEPDSTANIPFDPRQTRVFLME